MEDEIIIVVIICMLLSAISLRLYSVSWSNKKKKLEQLQRYWKIETGMTEYEMLSIMGSGYNRSFLKNNRIKYEWRLNAESHSSSYNGFSVRIYSGVKKVEIYVKDGLVEEVKPYNI